MKKFWCKHITIYTGIILWLTVAGTIVTTVNRAEADEQAVGYAIALVNLIRQAPLSYAESLGYSRENILAELPWLSDELSLGVPDLEIDESLTQSASANNIEGVAAAAVGYSTSLARTGSIVGAVSFDNFMDPYTAVQIVVNNQYIQELSAGYVGQRCILDADLEKVGAAFDAVTVDDNNTYMLTISLGSATKKTDRQILNQINQLRADPVGAGAILNLDLTGFAGDYSPLFVSDLLDTFTATSFAAEANFRGHLQNYGYAGYSVGKVTSLEGFPKSDLNAVAYWMFSSLVVNEVKGASDGSVIFGDSLNDVGMSLIYVEGDIWDYAALTVIAGQNADPDSGINRIYGLVFKDIDQNGIYTPGEGRSGETVQIFRADTLTLVAVSVTDNTGHFQADLVKGLTYIVLAGEGDSMVSSALTPAGDQFISIRAID